MASKAMLDKNCPHDDKAVRTALRRWGFNTRERDSAPAEVEEILRWVSRHSRPVSALSDATVTRKLMNAATTRLDGMRVAASTNRWHRVILSNALTHAVELGLLDTNPIPSLKWKVSTPTHHVDRKSVVNPEQARRLLGAVEAQKPSGPLLMPFFATLYFAGLYFAGLYFAGLRPEEAVNLKEGDLTLPDTDDAWGELYLTQAAPDAGKEWTGTGEQRDLRGLKHRPQGHGRPVPCPPELVAILRNHLKEHGAGPDGLIFRGRFGGMLSTSTIKQIWAKARVEALSTEDAASPIARRPYDLRHACLSTWLNAGVSPKQVAEWAGNSVEVLHRTYEKCLVGHDQIAMRRIDSALYGEFSRSPEAGTTGSP
ncbi:tyrosine-type recombinase/integrase [Acrocarpospora corrugata]|nr:tyrosine-type recombinase/integrase [Acrocarpospora corrugata]